MKRSRWTAAISVVVLLLVTVVVVSAASYVVQPGDNLTRISRQFGVTIDSIVRANNIPNPNLIYVGQVLEIPDAPGQPTPVPTEEPTPAPTEEPPAAPTEEPTVAPTDPPTAPPTEEPAPAPTDEPTVAPAESCSGTCGARSTPRRT